MGPRPARARPTRDTSTCPRLIEGNVALQVFAASTKSPRHLNIERNDDRTDDIILLALAEGWPPAHVAQPASPGRCTMAAPGRRHGRALGRPAHDHPVARPTSSATWRAGQPSRPVTAGLLAIEGAHALDDDPANVEVVVDAGFRMMSPSHFFDNAFGGSAHGVEKGGLTRAGREMIARMEARGMIVDVAHASAADDRRRPRDVDATGRRLAHRRPGHRRQRPEPRRTSSSAAIAATGGLIGIGFWPTASRRRRCRLDRAARSAMRSAWPASTTSRSALTSTARSRCPFDASGMVQLTDALLEAGLDDDEIAKVMGGNAFRVLADTLPAA